MQPTSPQVKKALITTPKTATNARRPVSEISSFKSPSKVMKNTLTSIKESTTPNLKSNNHSFMDNSTLETK